jgi:hypothetical protein
MDNPFKKRATEFIDEPLALLALLSAEPVRSFFGTNASVFFDRLALVVGTPGSGKTTLARLMEIDTLVEVVRSDNRESRQLSMTLSEFGILNRQVPAFLAHRIPCGSNFRDIWELPYPIKIRSRLLKTFIQVKAVLGWLRKLERLEVDLTKIQINIVPGMESHNRLLHTESPVAFREHGRKVEEDVLRIITSLLPPPEGMLAEMAANSPYDVFDCIESFDIPSIPGITDESTTIRPMIILDDAHELHSKQFADIDEWLRNREIKIPRWIMTRVDAMGPEEFRKAVSETEQEEHIPGTTQGRDRTVKLLQGEKRDRRIFRSISRDVCRRYFEQIPAFRRRGIETLEDCLNNDSLQLAKADIDKLKQMNTTLIQEAMYPKQTVEALKNSLPEEILDDEREALLHILLQREKRKTPQVDMFGDPSFDENEVDEADAEGESEQSKRVKPALLAGASIQMTHRFGRPFFYSFERLSDASSDNIEQFINLAGSLVDEIETRILRGKKWQLDARQQHQIMTRRAEEIIKQWDFPHCESVKKLVNFIASRCITRTMEPNAPLNGGANAFGIPQAEMNRIDETSPTLVPVLHYALAYNAISLKENYSCKKRLWCLFELGGLPIVASRLTLSRGGFCEGHLGDLRESIPK